MNYLPCLGGTGFPHSKPFCGVDSSLPLPQGPEWIVPLDFPCGWSAVFCTLLLIISELCSFHVFQPGFLAWWDGDLHWKVGEADSAPLPGWGGKADQPSGLARIFIWGPESSIPMPHQVSWSVCTTILTLQISKTVSWDYYLADAHRILVCQDLNAGCCKILPILFHNYISSVQALWIPQNLYETRLEWGFPQNDPQC